eukprot:5875947-Amphidinium_carterae.1
MLGVYLHTGMHLLPNLLHWSLRLLDSSAKMVDAEGVDRSSVAAEHLVVPASYAQMQLWGPAF